MSLMVSWRSSCRREARRLEWKYPHGGYPQGSLLRPLQIVLTLERLGKRSIAMFGLGAAELILILAIGLLLFGNRLPDVARSLGKTFTTFRKEIRDVSEDIDLRP